MKYQIIKNTMTSQGKKVCGDVVELSDDESKNLMAIGRCVPYHETENLDRSIGLVSSEQKVSRRGRPRKNVIEEEGDAS